VNVLRINLADVITGLRVLLTPSIFLSITSERLQLGLSLYLVALLSDLVDGYFARRTGTASPRGAFLDVCADFILAFTGVLGCAVLGRICFWCIGVVTLMFAQFILGFGGRVVYDPFGKFFGVFTLVSTPFLLVGPVLMGYLVDYSILFLGIGSFIARRVYLKTSYPSLKLSPRVHKHVHYTPGLNH
jgi:phosphatidylglycerophosphate synthase